MTTVYKYLDQFSAKLFQGLGDKFSGMTRDLATQVPCADIQREKDEDSATGEVLVVRPW